MAICNPPVRELEALEMKPPIKSDKLETKKELEAFKLPVTFRLEATELEAVEM